jgi:2-(1,2-epoxy-1,2-dihydrophenyl)acetyl-CoA isomerase
MGEAVQFRKNGKTATVTLNRPERLNALDAGSCRLLMEAIRRCEKDSDIRAIVLTGAGKAFCAGGDVREMRAALKGRAKPNATAFMTDLVSAFNDVILSIRRLKKPVIGAINGICSGGGAGLAFACDLLIAAREAKIHIPNARIGLIPDGGNSFFLPRMLGIHKAAELFLTGRALGAEEGFRLGIFTRLVSLQDLLAEAKKAAEEVAKGPCFAMGLAKEMLNEAFQRSLESQLQREREAVVRCAGTRDFEEGIQAFFEKREPDFLKTDS